jgi:hypothetical protein
MNEHTRIYYLQKERLEDLFQDSTEKPGFSCGTRTFTLVDTEEPGWFYGTRSFKLSDTKELVYFCRVRLECLSKEVVDKIAFCWSQRLALRSSKEQIELTRGIDLSKANKHGQYADFITIATNDL